MTDTLFLNKTIDIPSQSLYDSLMMLLTIILTISTAITVTALSTEGLFFEALAVDLQTFWFFTVATYLFLQVFLLFLVDLRDYDVVGVHRITPIREGTWRIFYGITHGEAFLKLFLEGFSKFFRIYWFLILHTIQFYQRIFKRTIALNRRRDQLILRTRAIQDPSKVRTFIQVFSRAIMYRFLYFLYFYGVIVFLRD